MSSLPRRILRYELDSIRHCRPMYLLAAAATSILLGGGTVAFAHNAYEAETLKRQRMEEIAQASTGEEFAYFAGNIMSQDTVIFEAAEPRTTIQTLLPLLTDNQPSNNALAQKTILEYMNGAYDDSAGKQAEVAFASLAMGLILANAILVVGDERNPQGQTQTK